MAADKTKVLASLNTYLKGKSHTDKFKTALAEKWAPKIENDEAIDAYLEDRSDILDELGNEVDRRTSAATKKAMKEAADKLSGENKDDDKKQPVTTAPDDAPAWAKALFDQNKELSEKVISMQAEKTATSLESRFKADERLKGIDPRLLKGRIPTKDEDYETLVTETAEELKDFIKSDEPAPPRFGQRLGADKPGFTGKANAALPTDKKVPAAITNLTAKIVANATKQQDAQNKTQIIS